MRWFHPTPRRGDERVRSWFAWWPVTVTGVETRWLESVMVRERYVGAAHGSIGNPWAPVAFVDPMGAYLRSKEMFL
jgi:hypothetical protein